MTYELVDATLTGCFYCLGEKYSRKNQRNTVEKKIQIQLTEPDWMLLPGGHHHPPTYSPTAMPVVSNGYIKQTMRHISYCI